MTTRSFARFPLLLLALAMSVLLPARVIAHCDGLDGPVVKSARAALDARNVALVAIWVQPQDEPEIRRIEGAACTGLKAAGRDPGSGDSCSG